MEVSSSPRSGNHLSLTTKLHLVGIRGEGTCSLGSAPPEPTRCKCAAFQSAAEAGNGRTGSAQHDTYQLARESGRLTEYLTQGRGVGPGNDRMSNTLDPMSLIRFSCPRSYPPSDQDASDKLKRQMSPNNISVLLSLEAMGNRKAGQRTYHWCNMGTRMGLWDTK